MTDGRREPVRPIHAANRNNLSVAPTSPPPEGGPTCAGIADHADVGGRELQPGGLEKYADLTTPTAARGAAPISSICFDLGFGQTGPNAGAALRPDGGQGLWRDQMSLTGPAEGQRTRWGVGIADVMCGMYAASASWPLCATSGRDRRGAAHRPVACRQPDGLAINEGNELLASGEEPKRRGNAQAQHLPLRYVFACPDGHP